MKDPLIAVYDQREIFEWPDDDGGKVVRSDLNDKTCCFCKGPLIPVDDFTDIQKDDERLHKFMPRWFYILICQHCGFWYGRLYDEFGLVDLDLGIRGSVRNVNINTEDISPKVLISYLDQNQHLLNRINPYKAEEVVSHILSDAFDVEVRSIGGRKDLGVDGYIVVNDKISTIVQVKWRKDSNKAEGVQIVREIAGTMLARGIPSGLIVTTRTHLSREARSEIQEINKREISGVGKIQLSYATYKDILSMLELSSRRISETATLPFDFDQLDIESLFNAEEAVASESVFDAIQAKARDNERICNNMMNDLKIRYIKRNMK